MKIKRAAGFLMLMLVIGFMTVLPVKAELASPDAFENAVWEKIIEVPRSGTTYLQSICVTDDYIVCLENSGDNSTVNDNVRAFYRNKVDAYGNPVEQYSEAMCNSNHNYEHCNGMAFNPNTQQIAIALYTNRLSEEHRGCVMLMDAKTLEYAGLVKISNDYNLLGIDYDRANDRYIIQTNVEGGYSFKILNSNFEVIEDLGEYDGTAKGSNFQDLCVDGDYIINFPLTLGWGIGDYINVYSISQRMLVYDNPLYFPFEGVVLDEPEGICQPEPGVFLVGVDVAFEDGSTAYQIYKSMVPYNLPISPVVVEQTVDESELDSSGKTGDSVEDTVSTKSKTQKMKTQKVTKDRHVSPAMIILIVIMTLLALAIVVLYLRVNAVRRERDRKRARARQLRQMQQEKNREIERASYKELMAQLEIGE